MAAADFQSTVRHGRRRKADHAVLYWRVAEISAHPRFGFIVAKAVGNAVNRNLVRRRFKSIAHSYFSRPHAASSETSGVDVVIRALPGAAKVDWVSLEKELLSLLSDISLPARGGQDARTPDTPKRTARE